MKTVARPELYFIEWIDSSASNAGWQPKAFFATKPSLLCRSVGYLVAQDDECITLCQTGAQGSYIGDIAIPKAAIKKKRFIRYK